MTAPSLPPAPAGYRYNRELRGELVSQAQKKPKTVALTDEERKEVRRALATDTKVLGPIPKMKPVSFRLKCEDCASTSPVVKLEPLHERGTSILLSLPLPKGWEAVGDGTSEYSQSGNITFVCPKCVARAMKEEEEADRESQPFRHPGLRPPAR